MADLTPDSGEHAAADRFADLIPDSGEHAAADRFADLTPDSGRNATPDSGGNAHGCVLGELLSAYLDGELRPGELDVVADHLATCLDCIKEFHELKGVRTAVRTMPPLHLPDRLVPLGHYGAALSAYLDGELTTAEHERVFAHLPTCELCRTELHELDAARTAIRSLPGLEPPTFLEFHRGEQQETSGGRAGRVWKVAAAAASLAAAAAIVVGLGGRGDVAESTVDLDTFADRHVARASVERSFVVIPAVSGNGATP